MILLLSGLDEVEGVKYPVDGRRRDVQAMALLEQKFDLVLPDPGLGFSSVIGSRVGDELLVMSRGLVGTVVGASRQIPETPLTLLSVRSTDLRNVGREVWKALAVSEMFSP